jgi:hypothetical protein
MACIFNTVCQTFCLPRQDLFDYAAPEIIDAQLYDEKSDIWSIGAVLFDVCTTSIYNVIRDTVQQNLKGKFNFFSHLKLKDFHSRLLNMRHSDEVVADALAKIENVFDLT